jgi:glycerol-3-phosphate dehydrogenase
MRSDPRALHGKTYDLLVVGGGIHGAAFAREAALRGLSPLLVDRGDFANGTSSRSSRLVHGGVRYLQQGHLPLVREALRERERLLRCAPHLVRPLPMLMPFFADGGGLPPWLTKVGLRLYGWLAGRSTLPRARSLSAAHCARVFPGLRARGLRGGALFFDAATEDVRLTLAVLEAAAAAGAVLCSHVEVTGCRGEAIALRDCLGGAEVEVRARHILNAAGPRVDAVRQRLGLGGEALVRASRGSHLVLPPRQAETALAAFLPDGRIQFVVPHRGGTLCGTTEVAGEPQPEEPGVPPEDVAYLLEALAHLLEQPPARADVATAYCGWRSLPARSGPAGSLNREAFLVREQSQAGAVHTVVGGKLTTHRSFAERGLARMLGAAWGPSPTRAAPLPGGDGPRDLADPLWRRHGSRAPEVRELAARAPELLAPPCPHRDFLGVEVAWGVQRQGAQTFPDLLLRRLFDVRGPCLDPACLRAVHALYSRFASPGAEPDADADCAAVAAAVRAQEGDSWRAGTRAPAGR